MFVGEANKSPKSAIASSQQKRRGTDIAKMQMMEMTSGLEKGNS